MTEYRDDPIIVNVAGRALPRTAWALVRDGVIAAVVLTYDRDKPPFGDVPVASGDVPLFGDVAIRVTGTHAAPGYLVDARGNVTPAEGRTRALLPGEAAYQGPVSGQVNQSLEENNDGEAHDDAAEQPAENEVRAPGGEEVPDPR